MKYLLTILVGCLSLSTAFGQLKTIDFKAYQYPYLKRQGLSLFVNLSNNQRVFDEFQVSIGIRPFSKENAYSQRTEASYFFYQNAAKKQTRIDVVTKFDWRYQKREIPILLGNQGADRQEKSRIILPFSSFFINQRHFFKDQWFWEYELDAQYDARFMKTTIIDPSLPPIDPTITNFGNIFATPTLRIGKGRIEPTSELYLAYYLLKALEKENRLNAPMNQENIFDLAHHVSHLKNTRLLDFRLENIYEAEQVDSFLVANEMVDETDARYFTQICDLLPYGYFLNRFSGSSIALQISYDYNNRSVKTSNFDAYRNFFHFVNAGIYYQYYKPLGLKYLLHIEADAKVGKIYETPTYIFDPSSTIAEGFGTETNLKASFLFFPNTRTELNYTAQVSWSYDRKKDLVPSNLEASNWTIINSLNATYYISPAFRLFANGQFRYTLNQQDDFIFDGLNQTLSISAGLRYTFF